MVPDPLGMAGWTKTPSPMPVLASRMLETWSSALLVGTKLMLSLVNRLIEQSSTGSEPPVSWRSIEAVEYATLEWVDWFNKKRLLEPIGNVPPAEAE
jgi:transposase InsO family protein